MKRQLFILSACIVFSSLLQAQTKQYKLIHTAHNADFNYGALNAIDTIPAWNSAFEPVHGKYIVYTFKAAFRGPSAEGTDKEFHDILVIKTDGKKKILEALQYTLEWGDQPSYDLFRCKACGKELKSGLQVSELELKNPENDIKQDGILIF